MAFKRKSMDSAFVKTLGELRGHIAKCDRCRMVSRAIIFDNMCHEGITLTHRVAALSVRLVSLHRKAYNDPNGFIYACPDRMRHGKDYAATAEPHPNIATQPELF